MKFCTVRVDPGAPPAPAVDHDHLVLLPPAVAATGLLIRPDAVICCRAEPTHPSGAVQTPQAHALEEMQLRWRQTP